MSEGVPYADSGDEDGGGGGGGCWVGVTPQRF